MLKAICMVSCLLLLILAFSAYAEDQAVQKLEEGITETATGWTEVPKEIADTTEETNVVEGVTVGTVKGAAQAVEQTTEGAVETATFYIPEEEAEQTGEKMGEQGIAE